MNAFCVFALRNKLAWYLYGINCCFWNNSICSYWFVYVCVYAHGNFFFFLRTHVWSAAPGTSGTPGTVPFPEFRAAVPA